MLGKSIIILRQGSVIFDITPDIRVQKNHASAWIIPIMKGHLVET